ncbi:MAG: hypothetical protein NVSMB45_14490 [Ginsengibacter sp.]
MNFEKEYYEYEGFWNDQEFYKNNIEKIHISFNFLENLKISNLLDAACGNGLFVNLLQDKFSNIDITAFDRSIEALKYVKTKKTIGEINNIPFPDKSFDCVVAQDVIEHLPVSIYDQSLQEIARVSKKYIIIAVPNDEKLLERSTQCPSCKAIFNYDLHMRSFSKDTINNLFKDQNFICKDIKTCDTNEFYLGQKAYGNFFYPKNNKRFKSPICPICGFKRMELTNETETIKNTDNPNITSILKNIPKIIWPKYKKDYEMVAFFEKMN